MFAYEKAEIELLEMVSYTSKIIGKEKDLIIDEDVKTKYLDEGITNKFLLLKRKADAIKLLAEFYGRIDEVESAIGTFDSCIFAHTVVSYNKRMAYVARIPSLVPKNVAATKLRSILP